MNESKTTSGGNVASSRLSAEYWRFWVASAVSNLGDGVRIAALPLLTAQITSSPFAVSVTTAAVGLPWVFFGPICGAIVDRYDRRKLMMYGQVVRGIAVTILAVWVAYSTPPLIVIYLVAIVVGTGEIIVDTASQAAIPMLAPAGDAGLERANGRLVAAQTLFDDVAGPPIGAALFAMAVAVPFVLDSATFVISALLLSLVRTPLQPERTKPTSSIRTDIVDGIVTLWKTPLLRNLAIGVGLINATLASTVSILVLFVRDVLRKPDPLFGLIIGIGAIGGFVGALVASKIVERLGRRLTIISSIAVLGAATASLALANSVIATIVLFTFLTFAVVVFNVSGQSLRQQASPPETLGRVIASFRLIAFAGAPIGALLGGTVAELFTIRTTFVAAGVFSIVPISILAKAAWSIPDTANDQ